MAHVFQKPSLLAEIGLTQLRRKIVLPQLIWTNPIANFGGSSNDTINVRIPAILASRERTFRGTGAARNVTADDLIEYVLPVTLDNVVYSAVNLTDEQLTLDIASFTQQVLVPQADAVAYGLEDYTVQNLFNAAPYEETFYTDADDTFPSIVDARQYLNDENIPDANRTLVVGSTFESVLLKDKQLRHFEYSGDASNEALRRATVMDIAGLQVIRSNALATDEAVLFHKTAFVLSNVAPVKPASVVAGASMSSLGFALRWISDYDYVNLTDRSLIDTYVGHKIVTEPAMGDRFIRATKLKLGVTGITALPSAATVTASAGVNHTKQITVKDSNGVNRTSSCTYSSSDATKATVGASTGLVTGVASGSTTITATYVDPQTGANLTDTVAITVS
ncbi:hypothetical protein A5747_13370 [Mycobacterium sp. IS-836]|uniref:P22 phage major capsid protein family protein n=1 Tax=Mycobacterium sp. IS-836 TaxID=1834160 RepID=UPI00096D0CDD|nr:P22 phage major capsid protein family protein [Mycobacterium sp. IS-836]OMC55377.1 hypothetical protein A5747_13370 [Mycobacterium sp. IS-836]